MRARSLTKAGRAALEPRRCREVSGRERGGWSGVPTHHAAGAPEVHVAADHEVGMRRSGDHVKQSHGLDRHPTNPNLMMWDRVSASETDDPAASESGADFGRGEPPTLG